MKITQTFTLSSGSDWRAWLEANHDKEQEIWLVYSIACHRHTNAST